MNTSLLYRTASVLLVLFAVGHTLAFRSTKDMAGADSVVSLNYLGGCTYWGSSCSNGQQGPPTPGDYCFFNPGDSYCRPVPAGPSWQQAACTPDLKNELLRTKLIPGRTIRMIRTSTGGLVRFEHTL